jgi:cation diffusion facilitator family transporter
MNRSKEIIRVSFMGIFANVILVAVKAVVGFASNSTAIILDAVNNLSDALSSVITIVGTRLARKSADKEHPFGHGRIEYITSFIVAILVIAAGVSSLKESVEKIITPPVTNYSAATIAVISAGIIAKLLIGNYFIKKGRELNSGSLSASGTDANGDALISVATLISVLVSMLFNVELDGILGAVISAFIIKTGISIVTQTVSDIIGVRIDSELANGIIDTVCSFPGIRGAYDMTIHSYGPEEYLGSLHVEVDDDMTIREFDALTREIVNTVYSRYGVYLTIGVYASSDTEKTTKEIHTAVHEVISNYAAVLQEHGFYFKKEDGSVTFDLLVDFSEPDPEGLLDRIRKELEERFPGYTFNINLDKDFGE